jgi:carboxypeptidase Q
MKKVCLTAISGLLLTIAMQAQQKDSLALKSISDDIMTRGAAYENLRFLCKKVGPRLAGSPQGAKAVQETARMMREMGADTVFLQECMVPHWVRGEKETANLILANGKEYPLKAAALGNSVGTPASGVKANVIEVRSFDELAQLKDNVKGNIVFFNYPMNPTYIKTFMAYGEAGVYRGNGPSMAAKYGAVGVIIRSLASNPDDHPHTGATRYNDSFPKLPAIAISTNDADYLSSALKKRMASQVYFKTSCKMLEDATSYNVVGEIRGSEFPNEIITVGGHIDSWDLAEGAHDDGAGCVQSMEIIRVFKALGIKPKRTIRVVMFQNEENGLKGGAKYAELAQKGKDKYVFALESDAGGFTPRGFGLSATPEQKAKIRSWAPLFLPYGVYEFSDGGGGADIGPLKPLGTAMAGLSPDSQRYFDIHHAETDVFEAVSRRELHLGATVMAGLVYMVAEYGL